MKKPLRKQGANSSHLIAKSRLNISDLDSTKQLQMMSTSKAIGRYHASKMENLLHRPRYENAPTVYYKVGDHLKIKNYEELKDAIPKQEFLLDQEMQKLSDPKMSETTKEQQYGNLMKQLYKIKSKKADQHLY